MATVQSLSSVTMTDTYDAHSSMQLVSGQRHIPAIVEALGKADSLGHQPITILDCGSATGLNSMKTFLEAIRGFRERSGTAVQVVHCDLPGNHWPVLFTNSLTSPHSYLSLPNTFTSGIGRSYHSRVFPSNSLSLVYSSHSLHWLSVRSQVRGQLQKYVEEDPELHRELRALSDADLDDFLRNRKEELKVGGRIIFQINGSAMPDMARFQALTRMQNEGLISAEPLQRFSVFAYPATPDSIRSVLARHPTLSLVSLLETNTSDSGFAHFLHSSNLDAYSDNYIRVMRSVTEPMMLDLMQEEKNPQHLVEVLFTYMLEIVKTRPVPFYFKELDVVIEKVAEE